MDKYKEKLNEYILSEEKSSANSRYLMSGILSFSETVEDPIALADILLKKYLTVEAVLFSCESDKLVNECVDDNTIFLLRLIIELSVRCLVQAGIGRALSAPTDACRFFEEAYQRKGVEELRLVCLNEDFVIQDYAIIAKGDLNVVKFDKDEFLKKAVSSGCRKCIMAHNHPGAPSTPSETDYRTTALLKEYLQSVGITLVEHIIIGKDGAKCMFSDSELYYSF